MKLYQTFPGHYVSYTPQIVAHLCNVKLENVYVMPDSELAQKEEFKSKKAHWNFPMLETADGKIITQSVAVAQFIAHEAGRTDLTGANPWEAAQIDQFCCMAQAQIFGHSYKIGLTTFGWQIDAAGHANALKEIKDQCKILNTHLQGKEFLVGGHLTLADIAVWQSLYLAMTLALDGGFRKAMPNLAAWFEKVSKIPQVV